MIQQTTLAMTLASVLSSFSAVSMAQLIENNLNNQSVTLQQHEQQQRYIVVFRSDVLSQEGSDVILKLPEDDNNQFKKINLQQFVHQYNGHLHRTLPRIQGAAVSLSTKQAEQLNQHPSVLHIEEDQVRYLQGEKTPWGITAVKADQVSDAMTGNRKVCVIDTGVDMSHEDLPNGPQITGEVLDATGGRAALGVWSEDDYGHGTHVAGIIAATSNGVGVTGVNPSAQLAMHHVKVIHNPNYWQLWSSDVIAAVDACQTAGANIINMSIAGANSSQAEEQAMQQAADAGLLLFGASGNRGSSAYYYPASYGSVVSVSAVDEASQSWRYNQQNDQVALTAPGVKVQSTLPDNQYGFWDGSSMATAYASGVAALVWSHFSTCTASQVRAVLTRTATDRGDAGNDPQFGFGIIDAKAAFDQLTLNGCELDPVQEKVPEAQGFQRIYGFDVPKKPNFQNSSVPYDINNSSNAYPAGLSRIGYYVEVTENGVDKWVWVSFDAMTSDLGKIGVPTFASGAVWNQIIDNLHVRSSGNANLTDGDFAQGSIEFWPYNYSPVGSKNIDGNDEIYDFDDKPVSDGSYGSMQIHGLNINQTLFAMNRFHFGLDCDFGIGSNVQPNVEMSAVNPDWTYSYNCGDFSKKRIEVWVKPN